MQPNKLITPDPASNTNGLLDDEDLEATLANVEEILESYEWANGFDAGMRKNVKGTADQIEARLISELSALEKVFVTSGVIFVHSQHPLSG